MEKVGEGSFAGPDLHYCKDFRVPVELGILRNERRVRTIVGDAHPRRHRLERQEPEARDAVVEAAGAVASRTGIVHLRKRGERTERSFVHVLDRGG